MTSRPPGEGVDGSASTSPGATLAMKDRPWLALALCLGALMAASFLVSVFASPPGLQDDARMFLSWMGRFDDAGLLKGDLLADYWESVTPPFYRGIFRAAWSLGIAPVVFAKILPILSYLAVAFFSFRFLRAIGAEPAAAFAATGALLIYLGFTGSIVNATPRSLWPPLLLAVLDGLARMRISQTAIAQFCLAGCYPQMTLVAATVIGLTLATPSRPHRLDLTRRRVVLVAVCAIATVGGMLPFLLAGDRFGPIVRLAEALDIPTFGASGRNRITLPDGSVSFVCGQRLGVFGSKCDGPLDIRFLLQSLFALIGPLVLLFRSRRPAEVGRIRSTLPFLLLAASAGWFLLSTLALFRLHLPSRYTAALMPLAILASVSLLVETLRGRAWPSRLSAHRRGASLAKAASVGVFALACVGIATIRHPIHSPDDERLVAAIRSLPKEAVVAGFVADLDFSPVLTGRSTLFSRELTIGYQLGYLRPMVKRMEDMRDVVLTHDAAILRERLARNHVDFFLATPETIAGAGIPEPFRGFFGSDLARLEDEAGREGPSALSRLAGPCVVATFPSAAMLDAACLTASAASPARG